MIFQLFLSKIRTNCLLASHMAVLGIIAKLHAVLSITIATFFQV